MKQFGMRSWVAMGAAVILDIVGSVLAQGPAVHSQTPEDDKVLATMPVLFGGKTAWTKDISRMPVDAKSELYLQSMGLEKGLHPDFGTQSFGIPFNIVDHKTPRVKVACEYAEESDPGPYPIPGRVKIEGDMGATEGDRHIILIDKETWELFETWNSVKTADGWTAGSGAVFNLKVPPHRPRGWTSADAAGLPIFPGLVRWDEVYVKKEIDHAIRFTVSSTSHGYVAPATHYAPVHAHPGSPPMGIRVRLKAAVRIEGYPAGVQVILKAMKKYGMILADNGSDWFVSGTNDSRWDDDELHKLTRIKGKDFEVIQTGEITTSR